MRHFFFIDPLSKLNIKKDSTLLLAANLKASGEEVYLFFEEDFYLVNNSSELILDVYTFSSSFYEEDGSKNVFISSLNLEMKLPIVLNAKTDVLHMRLDPPFDSRYLRYLWMLKFFKDKQIRVINNPEGILKYNEKLWAYTQNNAIPTYVGISCEGFYKFVTSLGPSIQELVLKPLDLYQGMGVEKIACKNFSEKSLKDVFKKKVLECQGAIVVQPFIQAVTSGEIRSIYFQGKELGSILKIPKEGEFLANIAQGASYRPIELSQSLKETCNQLTNHLLKEDVLWVAFDILGDKVSEINITCPGLLVEVSRAHQKNFSLEMMKIGF